MIRLARLLIKEKWRRIYHQYNWAGCLALALACIFVTGIFAIGFAHAIKNSSPHLIAIASNAIWAAWVLWGLFFKSDLTWHLRSDAIKIFPFRSYLRMYWFQFFLSYFTFPIVLMLLIFETAGLAKYGYSLPTIFILLFSFSLQVASVRVTVSLVTAVLYRAHQLQIFIKITLFLLAVLWIAASYFIPNSMTFLPGFHFGLILSGTNRYASYLYLAGFVLLFAVLDYRVQYRLTYSGIAGPCAGVDRRNRCGWWLLLPLPWPPTIWRISLVAWLRNQNALILFIFGTGYVFTFLFFLPPTDLFELMSFSLFGIIFHGVFRGNLLGVDHHGIWLYYMFPRPLQDNLAAKNQTLTLLQFCMIATAAATALFHPLTFMTAAAWLRYFSCIISTLLLGEIGGCYFSLYYPEPMDRAYHFSGSMTVGGLVLPFLQLVFMVAYMVVSGLIPSLLSFSAFWFLMIATPVLFGFVLSSVLNKWAGRIMLLRQKIILAKLSVYSS